jgi:2-methylisocitrate lyase-like PEP mutase family enzyme
MTQQNKAELFNQLHRNGKMLILPNIWDPLTAALLENLEYSAIATASASIAFTNGYDDGENIPFKELLDQLKKITDNVNIPVTADIEMGYSNSNTELQENIKLLINTGIVGINIEDGDKKSDSLLPIETQCERIKLIKDVSSKMGIRLFINARTDVYIKGKEFVTDKDKFEEILRRGRAYSDAGADCFFPIVMKQKQDIQKLIAYLSCPVNILALQGVPDLKELEEIGVARVSLGPGFLKIAIRALKEMAIKLKNKKGFDEIFGNDINTDYLKRLINKKTKQ